jgi:hypothetical protein
VNVATFTYPAHYLTVLFPLAYGNKPELHRSFFIDHKKMAKHAKKRQKKSKRKAKND